ncbi:MULTISPECIES: AI-2E family transporter [Neobacillus]|uniref:AI-2E family transporter n=1 Tax=Neobacillus rhizophilus TaxID=2833579 RepID=A0A942U2I3_9BACI|nr:MULTISPECIES: AI-2E family transporter [Neobacillus]MBS4211643.1 AI-2E family transporter [Neobacillus rhizophilus]MBU8919365.1 AI-2E family transporter [Bacillus sp. FJAT-29953]
MSKSKLQFWLIQILLILSIIFVSTKITFMFKPIGVFFSTVFFPILITGFLYFLLNPLVNFLERKKLPRIASILIIYVGFIGLLVLAISSLVPIVSKQATDLANNLPVFAHEITEFLKNMVKSSEFKSFRDTQSEIIDTVQQRSMEFANTLPKTLTNALLSLFGMVTNLAIILVTVPFLLFYMFKDGHKFPKAVSKFFPSGYRDEGLKILKETGETLSAYIQGQVMVALAVGTLSFIGYLIIDMPYALILALIVAFTNIIPYVGPIIGGTPAVLVAFFDSPTKALLVIVVILVAQQIEGNFLSPMILGKSLDTHPATIIIILLAAGNLAGVLGMVLAVPTYAVSKVIVLNLVRFLRARKAANKIVEGT